MKTRGEGAALAEAADRLVPTEPGAPDEVAELAELADAAAFAAGAAPAAGAAFKACPTFAAESGAASDELDTADDGGDGPRPAAFAKAAKPPLAGSLTRKSRTAATRPSLAVACAKAASTAGLGTLSAMTKLQAALPLAAIVKGGREQKTENKSRSRRTNAEQERWRAKRETVNEEQRKGSRERREFCSREKKRR